MIRQVLVIISVYSIHIIGRICYLEVNMWNYLEPELKFVCIYIMLGMIDCFGVTTLYMYVLYSQTNYRYSNLLFLSLDLILMLCFIEYYLSADPKEVWSPTCDGLS